MNSTAGPPWITIVSGLPRSGTSMMMQMLAAGGLEPLADHLRAADEDNVRGYFEFEPVKRTRTDPSWLPTAVGKVVKMIYLLLYDLPADFEYRVVFMQRDIHEVLASQGTMLARRGAAGAELSASKMADAFLRQRQAVESWLAQQPHFKALNINYHDVLAMPGEQAARINEFLEGALDLTAMSAAVDPALRRQKA